MKELIENIFTELEGAYRHKIADFFFTEKELHSYFLYLCFLRDQFVHNNYMLVHAEYPTPFKCSYNDTDVVKLEDDNSKKSRAHIDMVVLNPNYIDWITSNRNNCRSQYISGIAPYGLFEETNPDLIKTYKEFYKEKKEPILKYAIEFKYIRHGCLGTKHPVKNVIRDFEKLKLLKTFTEIKYGDSFEFVENTLLAIFIRNERSERLIDSLEDELMKRKYNREEVKIVKSKCLIPG